jgi:hypothetical protein
MLLPLLLIALGAAAPARAEECKVDARELTAELMLGIPSIYDIAATFPPVAEVPSARLADGSYRTRYGIVIDKSCLVPLGDKPKADPAEEMERALGTMLARTRRCGRRRLLGVVERTLYAAVERRPRFVCEDRADCGGENAAACGSRRDNRIIFRMLHARTDAGLLFHELLHVGGVDNQNAAAHNKPEIEANFFRDQVYFWQATCFMPGLMIDLMRGKPDACVRAMRHNDYASTRFSYNRREEEATCGLFRRYLDQERVYERNVSEVLVPEIFACAPHLDAGGCPDVERLNRRLRAAGLPDGIFLPGEGDGTRWLQGCAVDGKASAVRRIRDCAERLRREVIGPRLETLVAMEALTVPESEQIIQVLKRIEAKADFVIGGPGGTSIFPVYADAGVPEMPLANATEKCLTDATLRGTSLCRQFMTTLRRPMATLLKYWE